MSPRHACRLPHEPSDCCGYQGLLLGMLQACTRDGSTSETRLLSGLRSASPAFMAPAAVPHVSVQASPAAISMVTKEELASKLNPAIGYFDPMGLGTADFWSQGNEATYAFLRHAEIKHGRVAMAAFVGYCVQSNGIHFPFPMTLDGLMPYDGTPPEQWDAMPFAGKCQIILFIGFLEWWGEFGGVHYMRGGVPGKYPECERPELEPDGPTAI